MSLLYNNLERCCLVTSPTNLLFPFSLTFYWYAISLAFLLVLQHLILIFLKTICSHCSILQEHCSTSSSYAYLCSRLGSNDAFLDKAKNDCPVYCFLPNIIMFSFSLWKGQCSGIPSPKSTRTTASERIGFLVTFFVYSDPLKWVHFMYLYTCTHSLIYSQNECTSYISTHAHTPSYTHNQNPAN